MRRKTLLGATALAVSAAALGAFAASGFGGGDTPGHVQSRAVNAGPAELEVTSRERALGSDVGRRGKRRRSPLVTHLVTTEPIEAPPGQSTFSPLSCGRFGQPIGGGIITDGGASIALSVLSRFNPNTGIATPRRYFVGARNDDVAPHTFLGTVVCAKGMRVR